MSASPYLFRAADHPLQEAAPGLQVREALSPFGTALRYQERAPGGPAGHWCETGRSVFVLSGRLRCRFEGHEVVAGPGETCCTSRLGRTTGRSPAWRGTRSCGMC